MNFSATGESPHAADPLPPNVGPLFAGELSRKRSSYMRGFRQWRWHLDEIYVKINGEMHYL